MTIPSERTAAIISGFFIAAAVTTGCAGEQENAQQPVSFADDNGEDVTVTPNGDGTETATYDDGRSVTFRRDDDGNMSFVSGTAGLLGGLAAGYLLARGFSGGAGYFDSSRNMYRATTPYTYSRSADRGLTANGISRSRAGDGNTVKSNTSNATAENASNGSVGKQGNTGTTAKTAGGFGGAGARSAAS